MLPVYFIAGNGRRSFGVEREESETAGWKQQMDPNTRLKTKTCSQAQPGHFRNARIA